MFCNTFVKVLHFLQVADGTNQAKDSSVVNVEEFCTIDDSVKTSAPEKLNGINAKGNVGKTKKMNKGSKDVKAMNSSKHIQTGNSVRKRRVIQKSVNDASSGKGSSNGEVVRSAAIGPEQSHHDAKTERNRGKAGTKTVDKAAIKVDKERNGQVQTDNQVADIDQREDQNVEGSQSHEEIIHKKPVCSLHIREEVTDVEGVSGCKRRRSYFNDEQSVVPLFTLTFGKYGFYLLKTMQLRSEFSFKWVQSLVAANIM